MRNSKKLFSLLTASALAASAFAGMTVTASAANGSVTLTPTESSENAVVVKAVYEEGKLKDVKIGEPQSVTKDTAITVDDVEPGTKVMLWDSIKNMKPLAAAEIAKEVEEPEEDVKPGKTFIDEDFSAVEDAWGFSGGAGASIDSTNQYLQLTTNNATKKNTVKTLDESIQQAKVLNVSFDWASNVEVNKDRSSYFALKDSDGEFIFAIYGKGAAKADSGIKYTLSKDLNWQNIEAHTTGKFYTVNLAINFTTGTVSGTIATKGGDTLVTIPETSIAAKNLAVLEGFDTYSLAPQLLDNVKIASPEQYKTTFAVTGNEGNTPVANAEITIGETKLTTDANGQAKVYLPAGTYNYTVSAAKHNVYSGQATVSEVGTVTTKMDYVGQTHPATVMLDGGDEYLYIPSAGENKTVKPYSAVVYDNTEQVMTDEEVVWSLTGNPENISIDQDGIVTISDKFVVTDDNGATVTVRAASKQDPTVYTETTLDIRNVARLETFKLNAPTVIKDGESVELSAIDLVDQYSVPFETEETPIFTVDNAKVEIDGNVIKPNIGTKLEQNIVVTAKIGNVETTATITVYGYDFYEPGIGKSNYSNIRTETVNGEEMIVWPSSQNDNSTQTITFPKAVELSNGSAKKFTFDNIWTEKTVGSQERSFKLLNSNGDTVLYVGFAGGTVVTDPVIVDGNYTTQDGVTLGSLGAANATTSGLFIFKTDSEGNNSVILQYNNGETKTVELGQNLGDIASIQFIGGKGAPDSRLLSMTNIKFADSDVAEVEIVGDEQIAKIASKTAAKQFKGSIFSKDADETFVWSVEGPDGVTIDQNGILYVPDSVATGTVTIKYTSSKNADKYASKEVTINDYASVKTFNIAGKSAVNAGETAEYSAENITDEYGDIVDMDATFAITSGEDIASINATTGKLTTSAEKTGKITISVTVGNPDKTITLTKEVEIAKFSYVDTAVSAASTTVDVTTLANYSADTEYTVTVVANDDKVTQSTVKSSNGKVVVDTSNAKALEVSPVYYYTNVGNISDGNGKEIPLADGYYNFEFMKGDKTRADIFVNGIMVGQNVDQGGTDRGGSNEAYVANDVKVSGGSAVVTMKNNSSNMSTIKVTKSPSIVERKTHLYIMGDSLVSTYYGGDSSLEGQPGRLQSGWGQQLRNFISDDINITNLAESGSDSLIILNTTYPSVIDSVEKGDYVILECGYNDRTDNAYHLVGSSDNMKLYVKQMVEGIREKGAVPILVTPNASRHDYKASVSWSGALKEAATESDAFVVDLSANSYNFLHETYNDNADAIGQTYNLYVNGAATDGYLHSSYVGAMKWAEIVAQGIYDYQTSATVKNGNESLQGLTVNTDYTYTFTDSIGGNITLQVK